MIYNSFKAVSIFFLIALVATVAAVILVIVVPVLLNVDILSDPMYGRLEEFMKRMLLYFLVSALGYVLSSWGRRLSMPKGSARAA